MKGQRSLRRSIRSFGRTKEDNVNHITGILGAAIGGAKHVEVPGRDGFVYVRVRDSLNELIQAYNDQVSPVFGLPVIIARDKVDRSRYRVIGRDLARYNDWGSSAYLPRHGSQHSFNPPDEGGDIVWVYGRQFMPLLLTPSGSAGAMDVIVRESPYYYDGQLGYAGRTGTVVFTSLKPTDDQARMILVYLDGDGNPAYATGTPFSSSLTGTAQVIPYIPTLPNDEGIPLGAIRLVSGTAIITWDNIYDLRPIVTNVPRSGHVIQDEGSSLTQRRNLNFIGLNVWAEDNAGTNATDIIISGSANSGHTIQDEGTPLSTRTNLNVIGSHLWAVDDPGNDATLLISSGTPGPNIWVADYTLNWPLPVWASQGQRPTLLIDGMYVYGQISPFVWNANATYITISGSPRHIIYENANQMPRRGNLSFIGANVFSEDDEPNDVTKIIISGSSVPGGSAHIIQDNGSDMTARSHLNFVGTNIWVQDDAGNDATKVIISGSSGGGSGGTFGETLVPFGPMGGGALTTDPVFQFVPANKSLIIGGLRAADAFFDEYAFTAVNSSGTRGGNFGGFSYNDAVRIDAYGAGGSEDAPTQSTSGADLLLLNVAGQLDTGGWASAGYLLVEAAESFTSAGHGSVWKFVLPQVGGGATERSSLEIRYSDVRMPGDVYASGTANFGGLYVNAASTSALLVEQTGVRNRVILVDTVLGGVGINTTPTIFGLDVSGVIRVVRNGDKFALYENDVDEADAYFKLTNGTGAPNILVPSLSMKGNRTGTSTANVIIADTNYDAATDSGACLTLSARFNNGAVTNRKLFEFTNFGTAFMTMFADGYVCMGTTVDDGVSRLQVSGSAVISTTLTVPGVSNLNMPYGEFSSSQNQGVTGTTTAYSVSFNTDDIKNKITHSTVTNNSRITISEAGTYLITVSAIADTTAANSHLELWLAVDGSNVSNTNTIIHIPTANAEVVLAVSFIYKFAANQYFELKYRGDNTGVRLLATAAGASPTRPAAPSVICTVNKIAV